MPAWVMIGTQARANAMTAASQRADVAAAALAASTEPAAVETAIRAGLGHLADRVAVHGLSAPVGTGRATGEQLAVYSTEDGLEQPATVVPVPGGLGHLEPVATPDGTVAVVEVFVPATDLGAGVAARRWWLALVGALLLGGLLVAGDRLMVRTADAARRVAAAARAFGGGENEVRVAPAGPRETAEAGTAFNAMVERVSRQRAAERELIADLSHRLRTPLTALRLEADRARLFGAAGDRLTEAVDAIEREVDHLINTARRPYEESAEPEPERCDAADVVRERMGFWAAVADDQSRPFRVYGTESPAPVPLPASDLAAALDALLGNVFRYTPQGTAFEVAVSRRDGYVAVRVDDAGPGIESKDQAVRRGASGRGSTGLGLDIVRRAALAARGGVDIDRSALGGASVVMVLADAEPATNPARYLLGFVGRLKRDPSERRGERRWGRRSRAFARYR